MKRLAIIVALITLSLPIAMFAHRLDEYLQATILSIDAGHVDVSMRLVPGVAVSSAVIASIDANADGAFSEEEQTAYAQRVLNDVSLTIEPLRSAERLRSLIPFALTGELGRHTRGNSKSCASCHSAQTRLRVAGPSLLPPISRVSG